jgi:hypothetical protein
MRVYIVIIGEGKLKSHQINGSLPLGNIIVHLPSSFPSETYWIDMGPRGFPPDMSQEIMFQTSLTLIRQSKVIHPPMKGTEMGY